MADHRTDLAYQDRYPNEKRFLNEVVNRPAWKRTLEKTLPAGPPPI